MSAASELLLAFYGDDFTGSTDALESLARAGVRTVLFTDPPTDAALARHPGMRAFGVAGMTRSLPPDDMERALRPALASIARAGAPIVHYKVCSTFDSSPGVGSVGRVIDVAFDIFHPALVPVVVGAPALGRYCVFGNLFARCGNGSPPYRLDRHPSMSRHPVTPMDEADLRLHLARQTQKKIALVDVTELAANPHLALTLRRQEGAEVVLIDLMDEAQLAAVGSLIAEHPFTVGSSGVESALVEHWKSRGLIEGVARFDPPGDAGPIVVLAGSCSPVTASQIGWAVEHGFAEVAVDPTKLAGAPADSLATDVAKQAAAALRFGRSVVVHTDARRRADVPGRDIAAAMGSILRRILELSPVRRVAVAGGDTSSLVARALGIEAVEMLAPLVRGSPLCRASAPGQAADNLQITFKGGQIGGTDFFSLVQSGEHNHA